MAPRALKTSAGMRRRIKKMHGDGKNIPEIVLATGCTYWQVYNVVNNRVNTGVKKKASSDNGEEEPVLYNPPIEDFESDTAFFEHQITLALAQLSNSRRMNAADRVKLLKDLLALKKQLQGIKLDEYIKRPDALLIINVIKRLAPDLNDEAIMQIIEEEKQKIKLQK